MWKHNLYTTSKICVCMMVEVCGFGTQEDLASNQLAFSPMTYLFHIPQKATQIPEILG